jgi:glucose/arabinose dehydrogenase/cytochrome c5
MSGKSKSALVAFILLAIVVVGAYYSGLLAKMSGLQAADVAKQSDAAGPVAAKQKKKGARRGQPKPYHGDLPSLAGVNVRDAVLEVVLKGLDYPWALEFLPDNSMLISEFSGRIKLFNPADKSLEDVQGMPTIPSGKGQVGLMDIALHPSFEQNRLIYFSHAVRSEGEEELYATAVSRARLVGNQLHAVEQIFVATPFVKTRSNFGGALEFDDQGYLYLGSGDRGQNWRAQNPTLLNGKIIRLEDSGAIPADNPFVADPDIDNAIYVVGVRNPQGLDFDIESGKLYETEHGPMGGDEVNIIERGKNYGWPTITYGANYTTQRIGLGTAREGLEQPLFYYLPSLAISPITIYRGEMFPEWEGDLLVGALKGAHISKLDLVDGQVKSMQSILGEVDGRVRDIKVAADGSIYVLVQNGGRLFRLYRDPEREGLEQPKLRPGKMLYSTACGSCHSSGQALIPQLNDASAWPERLAQGDAVLYAHAIDGYRGMPPKGLCDSCSDEEIRLAVDYMLEQIKPL